ncbi:30S ribosomal protein S9 [Candidatus Gracilibacteria bacterium]|jgi:small subunit ribosomal protein S9|nr:30S ribosomal protein S9 [Candidatus Gracilibacteria bacterium]
MPTLPNYFYANGYRKTSTAKVRLFPKGTGKISINGKGADQYLTTGAQFQSVLAPLKLVGMEKTVDITVVVAGGGIMGQADAIRHGITRALTELDLTLRSTLKKAGFLTRDPRAKERKKPGLRRARRAPQWSKR